MLDLIREIETDLEDGWEAASRVELQTAEHTRRAVARFARALWITLAIMLVFNSERLVTWVNGFGVGPVQDTVVALSVAWNERMLASGFTEPSLAARGKVDELRGASWAEFELRVDSERARAREGARLLRGGLGGGPG
ncbi:MAG: hypothetical protein KF769_12505 [Parvibaculum sp.]|uniref:hypothetical protein n=1 Tax=Parvibaculum sp. TaxID=2024848 RepID=UPI001E176374|nr:hypothetical protein [Parvibaculum sp.]MBX3489132.1 hypothetical protein [Parvibaculum sp.]MBX3497052.1 hypothetical protein [Parvibaculum sp.]MCW5726995.1 hypothetical protein [Parvibaculum sp.]